jgi:hypothetical protein
MDQAQQSVSLAADTSNRLTCCLSLPLDHVLGSLGCVSTHAGAVTVAAACAVRGLPARCTCLFVMLPLLVGPAGQRQV